MSTSQDPVPIVLTDLIESVQKYPRTLLIGDSTVEWFSRILDPDGEQGGNIVGAGRVAYATRKSDVRYCHTFFLGVTFIIFLSSKKIVYQVDVYFPL